MKARAAEDVGCALCGAPTTRVGKRGTAAEQAEAEAELAACAQSSDCAMCGAGAVKMRCSRCRLASFCNEDCQRRGWREHKLICKSPEERMRERERLGERLYEASARGDLETVNELIAKGANVDHVNKFLRFTSLMIATQWGFVKVMRALLDANAQVDFAHDLIGCTAMTVAGGCGRVDVLRVLIDAKADVNKARRDLSSPLHQATEGGHEDAVSVLIAAGAQVNAINRTGISALFLPVQRGQVRIVRELIAAGCNVNYIWPENGTTALIVAAQNGHLEVVRLLLEAGADPRNVNINGHTALDAAKYKKHAAVVALLEAKLRVLGGDC